MLAINDYGVYVLVEPAVVKRPSSLVALVLAPAIFNQPFARLAFVKIDPAN